MDTHTKSPGILRTPRKKKCILSLLGALTVVLILCIATPLIIIFNSRRTTTESIATTTALTTSTSTTTTSTMTTTSTSSSTTTTTITTTTVTSTTTTSVSTTTATTATTSTVSISTSTSSTTASTTTTTQSTTIRTHGPLVTLTISGDTIIGLYNTTAGGPTGGSGGHYISSNQGPICAIDSYISTKYLNTGGLNCELCMSNIAGVDTGYFVIPAISSATVAQRLIFATANDFPTRDPIRVTLEGSSNTNIAMLHQASSWTLIYTGPTGIDATADPGRNIYVSPQNFSNTTPYASYRLLITAQRGPANSVQYAEAHIIGYVY